MLSPRVGAPGGSIGFPSDRHEGIAAHVTLDGRDAVDVTDLRQDLRRHGGPLVGAGHLHFGLGPDDDVAAGRDVGKQLVEGALHAVGEHQRAREEGHAQGDGTS